MAVHVPGALLAGGTIGVVGVVEARLGCGELAAADAVGDEVIGAGLVATVHAPTRRPTTIAVVTREIEGRVWGLRIVRMRRSAIALVTSNVEDPGTLGET